MTTIRCLRADLEMGLWVKTTEPDPDHIDAASIYGPAHTAPRRSVYVRPGEQLPHPTLLADGELERLRELGALADYEVRLGNGDSGYGSSVGGDTSVWASTPDVG